jgi:hypothetical protein
VASRRWRRAGVWRHQLSTELAQHEQPGEAAGGIGVAGISGWQRTTIGSRILKLENILSISCNRNVGNSNV